MVLGSESVQMGQYMKGTGSVEYNPVLEGFFILMVACMRASGLTGRQTAEGCTSARMVSSMQDIG